MSDKVADEEDRHVIQDFVGNEKIEAVICLIEECEADDFQQISTSDDRLDHDYGRNVPSLIETNKILTSTVHEQQVLTQNRTLAVKEEQKNLKMGITGPKKPKGRPLDPVWQEFTDISLNGKKIHCLYCNETVSARARRMSAHLFRCNERQLKMVKTNRLIGRPQDRVWKEFTEISADGKKANCMYCKKTVSARAPRMKDHLLMCSKRKGTPNIQPSAFTVSKISGKLPVAVGKHNVSTRAQQLICMSKIGKFGRAIAKIGRKQDLVWQEFNNISADGTKVVCRHCNKDVSARAHRMKEHLLKCSSASAMHYPQISKKLSFQHSLTKGGSRGKNDLDIELGRMIFECNLPFSIVEHPSFIAFLHKINPGYKLPLADEIYNTFYSHLQAVGQQG